ncbi:ABC transporter permease [Mesorhizobium sp.]|uniref:ABC transporter permease n=1 Tax=Mesorhizobium sp. TaxID=1871066 RepID=UPI000FE96246|nr:ABC transporter permease [Mesorhizobium sp.]RWD73632.1 MAG: ABC transporter permease [Mesorhizobium sp.]TIV61521.1 MAG: ABC transporter permease [Mesorhizobium sp.]
MNRTMPGPRSIVLGLWSLLVAVFLFAPIVAVLAYSFNVGDYLIIWKGAGLRWYGRVLSDQNILLTLRTSVTVALATSVASIALGCVCGTVLARRPAAVAAPLSLLLLVVLSFPEIVKAVAYLIWFVKIDLDAGLARMVIAHTLFGGALVAFIVRARLGALDPRLEEAAADLGASPGVAFMTVTLPLLAPALVVGGLLAFTISFDDVIVSLFVSTAKTTTLPVYILASVRQGLKGDIAAISALMFGLTILVFAAAGLFLAWSGASRRNAVLMLAGQGETVA